jgi:hypothetical protein
MLNASNKDRTVDRMVLRAARGRVTVSPHLSVDFLSRKMLNGTKGFYDFPMGVRWGIFSCAY